jgi:hypothetical protein
MKVDMHLSQVSEQCHLTTLEISQPVPKNRKINSLSDNADQGILEKLSESLIRSAPRSCADRCIRLPN